MLLGIRMSSWYNPCPQTQVRTKCDLIYISFKATLSPQLHFILSLLGFPLLSRTSPDSGRGSSAQKGEGPWLWGLSWSHRYHTTWASRAAWTSSSPLLLPCPPEAWGSLWKLWVTVLQFLLCRHTTTLPPWDTLLPQGKAREPPFPGTLEPLSTPRPVSQRYSAPSFKFSLPFGSQTIREKSQEVLQLGLASTTLSEWGTETERKRRIQRVRGGNNPKFKPPDFVMSVCG